MVKLLRYEFVEKWTHALDLWNVSKCIWKHHSNLRGINPSGRLPGTWFRDIWTRDTGTRPFEPAHLNPDIWTLRNLNCPGSNLHIIMSDFKFLWVQMSWVQMSGFKCPGSNVWVQVSGFKCLGVKCRESNVGVQMSRGQMSRNQVSARPKSRSCAQLSWVLT